MKQEPYKSRAQVGSFHIFQVAQRQDFRLTCVKRLMRTALIVSLAVAGCAQTPLKWEKDVVDGEISDVGRFASMVYHQYSAFDRRIAIAYEDVTNQVVKVGSRRRDDTGWSGFDTTAISGSQNTGTRAPAIAKDSQGFLYTAFVEPEPIGNFTFPQEFGKLRVAAGFPANQVNNYDWICGSITQQACELVDDNVIIAEPSSIVYQPATGGGSGLLHIVYARYPDDELFHARRQIDETDWTIMRVGASDEDPLDGDIEGRQPKLFLSHEGILQLLFIDGAKARMLRWNSFGWQSNAIELWSAGSFSHNAVGVNFEPGDPDVKRYAYARGRCENFNGELRLWQLDTIPPGNSQVNPGTGIVNPIPSDPSANRFCYPSIAFNSTDIIYISAYAELVGALTLFRYEAGDGWTGADGTSCQPTSLHTQNTCIEYIDNLSAKTGLYTSIAYDDIANELIISYYDESNGDLKVAIGDAN